MNTPPSRRGVIEENNNLGAGREEVREEQDASQEEISSHDIIMEQQEVPLLAITDLATIPEPSNDYIGITPITLRMLRRRQSMENYPVASITVSNNDQNRIIPAEAIVEALSPEETNALVRVAVENMGIESNTVEDNDLAATYPIHYLSTKRKELKEQQGLSLDAMNLEIDDEQLEQDEIALNRAAIESGITPEELRVLRALENSDIINSAFAEAHYTAQRLRLEYSSTVGNEGGYYLARFRAHTALQESYDAARLAQQAEEEMADAIESVVEIGLRASVAVPLRRQTYSF